MTLLKKSIRNFRRAWGKSIRRQLAWSFSFASLCIILGSGYLLYRYEKHFLYAQDTQVAIDLVKTLASSAGTKVLAEDAASLNELMDVAQETKNLKSAMVTNLQRDVLVSTEGNQLRRFLSNSSASHFCQRTLSPRYCKMCPAKLWSLHQSLWQNIILVGF